jgi:hypothetical protein
MVAVRTSEAELHQNAACTYTLLMQVACPRSLCIHCTAGALIRARKLYLEISTSWWKGLG